jgi:hypothetical protein
MLIALEACSGSDPLEGAEPAMEGLRIACIYGDPLLNGDTLEETAIATVESGFAMDQSDYDTAIDAARQSQSDLGGVETAAFEHGLRKTGEDLRTYRNLSFDVVNAIDGMWFTLQSEGDAYDYATFWLNYAEFREICGLASELRTRIQQDPH